MNYLNVKIRVKRIDNIQLAENNLVKVTEMGNITEVMWMAKKNEKARIKKLSKDSYVILETGEVRKFEHIDNRMQDIRGVRVSLRKLRAYLNTNITDVDKCRWVTLTYAENMTDPGRLYLDFKNFNKRFRYWLKKKDLPLYEYIVAMEPQGRGAWHCHVVFIFPDKAPFIPNEDLRKIWKQGFVTVKALDDVDNVGAYLTAYLGDMELGEALESDVPVFEKQLKEVEYINDDGELKKKKYVKGARLCMYPPNFNLYRKSSGIKQPESYYTSNGEAEEKVSSHKLTFQKTVQLNSDDDTFSNIIDYRYYNNKVSKNQ